MLKKIYVGLLFVGFGAFGAAGSSLVPIVAPEGASPFEVWQKCQADLKISRSFDEWDERMQACFGACEKALDEVIEQKKYDQLLPMATFLLDGLGTHIAGRAYDAAEKCMFNYPDTEIFFISDDDGRMLFAEVLSRKVYAFDIAKLEAVCSRISPKDFTEALQVAGRSYDFRSRLCEIMMVSSFFTEMEASGCSNVQQLVALIHETRKRIDGWARYVQLEVVGVKQSYSQIVEKFEKATDNVGLDDAQVLLHVYQTGIENREIAKSGTVTILSALATLKRMGINPRNPFMPDKPKGESLFSAGLMYSDYWSYTDILSMRSLLSPEEFDVEVARLQGSPMFRSWYVKNEEFLFAWAKSESLDALNRAGHNALLQHQTLFTLLVPMLKEMHA